MIVLSFVLDGASLIVRPALMDQFIGAWGAPVLHFLVSFVALGVTFTYLKRRDALKLFEQETEKKSVRIWAALAHACLYCSLVVAGQRIYGTASRGWGWEGIFLALGIGVLVSGLAIVAPMRAWSRLAMPVGIVWVYAAVAALAATLMTAGWRMLWKPASVVTYQLVQWILRPLVGQLVVDPSRMRIGTMRFGVIISPECSGLEGVGLLLLFSVVWLWMYRRECRFPQALLMVPAGLVTLFLLNSARIAALVLIGHAGARQIATQGFHSQAGWIAFNGVAFGLCVAAGRIPWMVRTEARPREQPAGANLVAVYLAPFLAILAAQMLTRAMTGGFEWLYPVRLLAAFAAFWLYRSEYRSMDWRFTWYGPAIGVLVFGIWIVMEWARTGSPQEAMPGALQIAPDAARWGWVSARILGAVVAAPVAEELAFRGYLMRRLAAEDFDRLKPSGLPLWTVAISSLLFGLMHGGQWVAATVAGGLYALAYIRKGWLGDAVVAHAVTNALIAVAVLDLGYWKLW